MRKNLLFTLIAVAGTWLNLSAAEITLTIQETIKDGDVSISFDDGEYENDSIDKVDDDDLDMGWEGEDLNIMTSYTRFRNVSIPQGSTIDSAFLFIYAHEDEADEARINFYAEDIDNSPIFSETEALADRVFTTATVRWVASEEWTMWEEYKTPDIASVIQEVIDRDGWKSGNALTVFMQGEDQGANLLDNARDFESYENIEDPDDGGDGLHHPERIPKLVIYYTPKANPSEITLKIIETHKDGDVSISYDDGEYENDSIDKVDDDDLDMGWEGEDLNIMTSYTRFQNVAIPQGSRIDSAFLYIYAHEDEADEARINFYAEDIDDSPMFSEDEALADRTYTDATVRWVISEEWTMWEEYKTPNIASVIQEVVTRDGWASGNALTIFMQGEDQGANLLDNARDFESFENIEDPDDGGDGLHHPERIPMLKVYFDPSGVVNTKKVTENTALKIYPNPSVNGIINIEFGFSDKSVITIFDISGKVVVETATTSQSVTLDISTLNTGMYFVKAQQNNNILTNKLIVK